MPAAAAVPDLLALSRRVIAGGEITREEAGTLFCLEGEEVDGICHCATLGTLSEEQARDLKAAGVRRINHNLETSKEFYPQIVTTHAWQERVDTVRLAQKVGLETCVGCIF